MAYTIEADIEQFTEADAESLEFATEDLEGLETESIENISLEDVNPESVVESLESLMEGAEANGYGNGYTRPSPSSSVNKQLLKTFTIIVKKLVKKIMSNPRTRAKLQAATRKGPTAVARLLTPSVAKVLPSYFRWMAPIYVPSVTRVLFGPLRKQAGVKAEEVEASPEWDFASNF
ncbi:hypothetical protein PQG02_35880 (plasmid) [Nostoc sp. UHCC 0926]|uniref:hypothetical protein n=1 Tax=Nostoc sp. UHCC 0926 TaxID=3025190 RepID=UPI002360288D|nr:hypothetical protein [Nostoc sp. UHCC 0926]WDD36523.1 hypothetical protein PQG02_35880 [Nostoc sp. UHCC 0926]